MKKIIYTQPDGTVAVVNPVEGARLAKWVVLQDGTVLVSLERGIAVAAEDLVEFVMGRIEAFVAFDGSIIKPVPVDRFLRRWPIEGAVAEWAETEDEFVERIARKDVPSGVPYEIVDESAIPADRTFRNAWKAGTGKVEHDMMKCREIHKNRLREIRAPKLAALDVEYMRALEMGDSAKAAEIAAQKQALRDVTKDPAIALAKTPDALKIAVPEVLLE